MATDSVTTAGSDNMSSPPVFNAERAAQVDKQIQDVRKITDYEIREWPIEVLVEKYTGKNKKDDKKEPEIFIPDYQREFVWTTEQQSRFIESLMINLPIPFLFMADTNTGDREGNLEVIDGTQRLRTLADFLSNVLRLEGLKRLDSANGMVLSDFSIARQKRFKRSTIRVIELTEQADEEARREMFDRLNSGGTKLKSMEVRRGTYPGNFLNFIERCAKNPLFQKICPIGESDKKHREYDERILRFFAYSNNYTQFEKRVDSFLDQYIKENENFNSNKEKIFLDEFEKMLTFVQTYFHKFTKKNHNTTPRIRFEMIAVGVNLALRENPNLIPKNIESWLDGEEFLKHTRSDASNSYPKLVSRIHFVRDNLLGRPIQPAPERNRKTNENNTSMNLYDE